MVTSLTKSELTFLFSCWFLNADSKLSATASCILGSI
ncbi:hypothetical protein SAMN05421807_112115 [Virgibacillus chiguensis]|uniref:Uncharacterized protein n=1 Tax=Virgibacillus chiguensis TaxID=411959 RepID=A0A1M5VHA0_9BACI|nr:hypothetical protein SAMN05421807_112115 [Virgibacillus chiguensis]